MSQDLDRANGSRGEVLLALARGGRLSRAELARRTGLAPGVLDGELASLTHEGAIAVDVGPDHEDRVRLTPAGAGWAEELLRGERLALGARVERVMPSFDELNAHFKELLHRWQVRPVGSTLQTNDHSDVRYDQGVLGELGHLGVRARALLDEIAGLRPRYARYRRRFVEAIGRAGAGEPDFVAGLSVDSAHSVWWELHADLLAVCGRSRGESEA